MGDILSRNTGVATINQSLAYMMRAGPPDSLDRMVATNSANLAMQQQENSKSGVMMALRNGNYTIVPVDTCIQGEKRVDVGELYDAANYRPSVRGALDKPMFLY